LKILEITSFSKNYGNILAVNDISFHIDEGEMFGLVGPDGAGKTTTIRTICGLSNISKGTIKLFDSEIAENRQKIQNSVGYLSQIFSLYGDLSVEENIRFFAEIHNIKDYHSRMYELLDFTRLSNFKSRLANNLSGGMKQKLALACSLIHKPKIIFLDEPTTGVDPVSRRDFWGILANLKNEGITIFLTTPYLDEAERCDRVALMHNGQILALDSPNNLKKLMNESVYEIHSKNIRELGSLLKSENYKVQLFGDRLNLVIKTEVELETAINLAIKNKIEIIDKRRITPSLENLFIYMIEKESSRI